MYPTENNVNHWDIAYVEESHDLGWMSWFEYLKLDNNY